MNEHKDMPDFGKMVERIYKDACIAPSNPLAVFALSEVLITMISRYHDPKKQDRTVIFEILNALAVTTVVTLGGTRFDPEAINFWNVCIDKAMKAVKHDDEVIVKH